MTRFEPLVRVRSFLKWVFAFEAMPRDPHRRSNLVAPGFLAWLFRPEPLPRSGGDSSPSRSRGGLLGWIFAAESFPDPALPSPDGKESTDGPQ